MPKHNMTELAEIIRPIISDTATALRMLQAIYGNEIKELFIPYEGKLVTRTGLISKYIGLRPLQIATKRAAYAHVFIKLGCLREECGGLRGQLLKPYKQHTVVWGMPPEAVVAILLNSHSEFNYYLSLMLDVQLPPAISIGALEVMLD